MTMVSSTGDFGPGCTLIHQEAFWRAADVVCARCGTDMCNEHSHSCMYCKDLKRIPWFCDDCVGTHEITRLYPGGCKGEFEATWYFDTQGNPNDRNFKGMQERAAERQTKRGLHRDTEDPGLRGT